MDDQKLVLFENAYRVSQKKYHCSIKHKMHSKRGTGFSKIKYIWIVNEQT